MRLLHTMIRVGDLQRSIDFYTQVLGMQLLRQKDYPDGKFTLLIRERGGKIIRDAGPMNAGAAIIAFVEDPDGYQIELIGKKY